MRVPLLAVSREVTMMNKDTIKKMKKATDTQFESIRERGCYKYVKADFDIEYQIALELAQARKEANLTQLQIAKLMDTQQSVVSRIERGANVSVATIARYAAACGKQLVIQVVS